MIRILFKQRLDDKSFAEGRNITMQEVSENTGLSRATINRISNIPGYHIKSDAVEVLCKYFDCEIEDLLVLIKD